jgi:hypothetical protein
MTNAILFARTAVLAVTFLAIGSVRCIAGVAYVSAVSDDNNVIVTAITDSYYAMAAQHTAYATAYARSPSGRIAQNTYYQRNRVSVVTLLPLNMEDGIFQIGNINPREWCPFGQIFIAVVAAMAQIEEDPYVKLVATSANPDHLSQQSGSADFRVEIKTSSKCMGLVGLNTGLTTNISPPPPSEVGLRIRAPAPDGDGIERQWATGATHTFAENSGHTFLFKLLTTSSNEYGTGTYGQTVNVTASTEIVSRPGVCKGPIRGATPPRDLQIYKID